jgi:hypothetical protein
MMDSEPVAGSAAVSVRRREGAMVLGWPHSLSRVNAHPNADALFLDGHGVCRCANVCVPRSPLISR